MYIVYKYRHPHNCYSVPKIIIFITDGKPQDVRYVPRRAMALRKKSDMTIFAIGVGTASETELQDIASKPYNERVFFMSKGKQECTIEGVRDSYYEKTR